MIVHVYTDGSYNKDTHTYGSGIVFAPGTDLEEEIKFSGDREELAKSWQITGEVLAVIFALQKVLDRNKIAKMKGLETQVIDTVVIHYDLEGIAKWPLGQQRAECLVARKYLKFMTEAMSKLTVKFIHVKAHSGNEFNDRADDLAREGCGLHDRYKKD